MKRFYLTLTSYVLVCIMLHLCISCSDSTPEPNIIGGSETLEMGSLVETGDISFSVNCDWTATADVSWVHLSQTKGTAGDYRVIVTVDANPTYDERKAIITISASTASTTFVVSQAECKGLFVSATELSIGSSGGNLIVPIKANMGYTCEVDDDCKSWVSIIQSRGLIEYQMAISVKENKTYDQRSGKIYILYGDDKTTITISQSQLDELILEQKEFEMASEGGQITIPVQANIDYNCEVLGEASNWISIVNNTTRGLKESTVHLSIQPNEHADGRIGQVKVTGASKESIISITQSQKDMLIVDQINFEVNEAGGSISIPVYANLTYDVTVEESAQKWLHIIQSRAIDTTAVNIAVDENRLYKGRSGKVELKAGDLHKIITISQSEVTTVIKPEMVDLGLSVKWASFNLGATVAEDTGKYYAWGELNGYYNDKSRSFYWNNYLSDFGSNMSSSSSAGTSSDPLAVYVYPNQKDLSSANDAAYHTFGEKWRMPSAYELKELIENCTATDGKLNGVNGCYLTSKINNRQIFIPNSGYMNGSALEGLTKVYFWTATPGSDEAYYAISYYNSLGLYNLGRCIGLPVRPVWGDVKSVPVVSLMDIVVDNKNITFKGKIDKTGGVTVTERGFVYSTHEMPTLETGKTVECTSYDFTSVVSDLSPNTTYYLRAYARNKIGTAYSAQKEFTTPDVEYIKIASESDLYRFADEVRNSSEPLYAELVTDIRLTSSWTPIGTDNKPFEGVFNGNNHSIYDIQCNRSTAGLFGVISKAVVQNLYVTGSLTGEKFLGGIAGKAQASTIDNCQSAVTITSGSQIGGIVGTAINSVISNCSHVENLIGSSYSDNAGGIVGETTLTDVYNCFNTGNMLGNDAFGGIVGNNGQSCLVANCYNKGHFKDMYLVSFCGGVVGRNAGDIANCYSTGTMKGKRISGDQGYVFCGGVVAYNDMSSSCKYCYYLQQFPINTNIDYVGQLNWGECKKCGSFDGGGAFTSSSLSYSGSTIYLRYSLNEWVNNHNNDHKYKKWDLNSGWPEFVQ